MVLLNTAITSVHRLSIVTVSLSSAIWPRI